MDNIISRETMRARGAKAFDQGRGVDDHGMNPDVAAVVEWQTGWRGRQIATQQAGQQLAGSNPP